MSLSFALGGVVATVQNPDLDDKLGLDPHQVVQPKASGGFYRFALAGAVDGILRAQSAADTHYFVEICGRPLAAAEVERLRAALLAAYRWQYILSGVQEPRFAELIASLVTPAQSARIGEALAPLVG